MRVYVLRSNRLDCKSILNEYSRVLLPKYTGKQRIIKSARPTPRRNFISLIPTISRYTNKISRQNLDRYYQAIVKCVQAVCASRHSLMNFNPRFNIDECPPRILHSPTPPLPPPNKIPIHFRNSEGTYVSRTLLSPKHFISIPPLPRNP